MKQENWETITLSLFLGIASLLFFGVIYPHHIHFQEQYQLFLYDSHYLSEVLSIPGGLADLLGRFLTQFFLFSWAGAGIIAMSLVCVFLLTLRVMKAESFRTFCLIPAFLLWIFLTDENALLGSIMAVILSLLAQWGIAAISGVKLRMGVLIISAPMLYWLLGPVSVLVFILQLLSLMKSATRKETVVVLMALCITLIMPLYAHHAITLPLDRLFLSPHYYRYPYLTPWILWMTVLCIVVLALLPQFKTPRWIQITFLLLLPALGGTTVFVVYNPTKEEILAYDYMARNQQWKQIVQMAEKRLPNNATSCAALNLALGKRGKLADHLFEYNQNGIAGLLPVFDRDLVSPLVTSEAFYQLGMINMAQSFVFEAQEAIPDFQKSARCYQRLAETNLINGHYEVARKYLKALEKTMFYKTWATDRLTLIKNDETANVKKIDEAVNSHKEYGRLRQLLLKDDYWFSTEATANMLKRMIVTNPTNKLAYEYMQAAYLLERDLDSFIQSLGLGAELKYQQMPMAFQQAYLLWWTRDHSTDEPIPNFISQNFIAGINQFYAMAQNQSPDMLMPHFGNTYWYYYFFMN